MTTREVDGTTHWEGCHDFGPKHYACLLAFCVREETHHDAEVARLTAERDALRAALVVPHGNAYCDCGFDAALSPTAGSTT